MKRRSGSAFGLHFDFHASPEPPRGLRIGAALKEEEIREICRLLQPDFLQVDGKGHPGWASWPTACGNAMPDIAGDPLALWRRVTREEGVALYLHYSGVIDGRYCRLHPEEAVLRADGTRSPEATRTAGRYADDLLIPQLKEIAGKYGLDGVWVDGDCWGTETDYDPRTVEAFERETGIRLEGRLPVKEGDPYFEEYREYNRELYRRYLRHYTDAVHAEYPDFQIASNWAFSEFMPEPVTAGTDFLSGDYAPWDSFDTARFAGRAIAAQGRTWDLMAWNFRYAFDASRACVSKRPVQMMQEAAAVTSQGGGFQDYITQYPDGCPRMEPIRALKPVADFVRAREPYCFRAERVPQVGVLLAASDRRRGEGPLFGNGGAENIAGLVTLLCDVGHSAEVLLEHGLAERLGELPAVAVPECRHGYADTAVRALLDYAEGGGSLLLCGLKTCRQFAEAGSGIGAEPAPTDAALCVRDLAAVQKLFTTDGARFGAYLDAAALAVPDGETVAWGGDTERSPRFPAAVIRRCGKGKIAAVGADLGLSYKRLPQAEHRELVRGLLDRLYEPAVRLRGAEGLLEISLLRRDGRLLVQLVNANGNHRGRGAATEDWIPPCRDVELAVRCPEEPRSVLQLPGGVPPAYKWEAGILTVRVDRVDLHEIIGIG